MGNFLLLIMWRVLVNVIVSRGYEKYVREYVGSKWVSRLNSACDNAFAVPLEGIF